MKQLDLFEVTGARLGFSRRILYADGGNAVFCQRQACEPGSHLGFAGSHLGAIWLKPCQY
jgi:hypothetical protein